MCCGIPAITIAVLLATIGLNVYLFIHVPKGFFPQQDNGRMQGTLIADQDTSFQAMQEPADADGSNRSVPIRRSTPSAGSPAAAETGTTPSIRRACNIQLKPLAERRSRSTTSLSGCVRSSTQSVEPRSICKPRRICASADGASAALYQFTHARRQSAGSEPIRAADAGSSCACSEADHRRQHRSAEQRAAGRGSVRSRHRRALRHLRRS